MPTAACPCARPRRRRACTGASRRSSSSETVLLARTPVFLFCAWIRRGRCVFCAHGRWVGLLPPLPSTSSAWCRGHRKRRRHRHLPRWRWSAWAKTSFTSLPSPAPPVSHPPAPSWHSGTGGSLSTSSIGGNQLHPPQRSNQSRWRGARGRKPQRICCCARQGPAFKCWQWRGQVRGR